MVTGEVYSTCFQPMVRVLCLIGMVLIRSRISPTRLIRASVFAGTLATASWAGIAHAASLDPTTWRGDARFLVAAVDSIHPRPYRFHSRAQWDSAAAALETRLPSLRYDQAVAGFSELIAFLGDGHSRLNFIQLQDHGQPRIAPPPGPGFDKGYPIECQVFADGLRIVRATKAHTDLLGARVLAINHRSMPDVVAAFTPMTSADNPMWVLNVLPAYLKSPGYMAAARIIRTAEEPLRLELLDSKDRRHEVTIAAESQDSTTTWVVADAKVSASLPLTRALQGPWAYADLGDAAHTVFVRIREIGDSPTETMAQFTARLFAHVDSIQCQRLILDLRGNGGGNNYLNQPLMHSVIARPAFAHMGSLFVVADRGTFSAAVSLASDLERETQALFVGEPTGGAPNSPGDPAHVTLPGSGLIVRISTVFWQGSDPRDPRAFIAPDLPAMMTWSDWMGRRDPAVAAILDYKPPKAPHEIPPNTHWGDPRKQDAKIPKIDWGTESAAISDSPAKKSP